MYFTLLKTTKVGEERIKILFSIVLSHQSAMIRASSRQKNSEDQRVISPHVSVMLYSSGFTMFGIIVIESTATWPITNFQSLFSLYLLPVLAFPLLHLIFPCCLCPQTLLTTTNWMMPLHAVLLLHCLSFLPQVLASAVKLLPHMPSQSLCHQLAYSLSALKLSLAILHNQFSPQSPYCSCTRPTFSHPPSDVAALAASNYSHQTPPAPLKPATKSSSTFCNHLPALLGCLLLPPTASSTAL